MFCGTTTKITSQPIPIQKNNTLVRKETSPACNKFDPFASSPPSNFFRNLNERRRVYHEIGILTNVGCCK